MSAAIFILTINVFTASVFCTCLVMAYRRKLPDRGEKWLALAFGLVAVHGLLEVVQPLLAKAEPLNFIVFITYLLAMTAMITGLARRSVIEVSPTLLIGLIVLGALDYFVLLGLDRHDPIRPLLYQAPFVMVQLVGCWILWRAPRTRINNLLLSAFAVSAAIFAGKPFLANAVGIGPDTQSFLWSDYGAFSQTFEAFFLIATGVLLAVSVATGLLIEITIRSETDKLSGLLNRRGFEERCDRMVAATAHSGDPLVLILADLDHFKDINDSFGHAVGDQVIAAFARVLRSSTQTSRETLIGRLGGEEFGVFLSGNIVEGRAYGENARRTFADLRFEDISPHDQFTASFGVAELQRGEPLPKLMSRADTALYEAKRNGRNRVRVAPALSIVAGEGSYALKKKAAS